MGKIDHIKWMLLRSRMTRQMEARGCTTVLVYIICVILLSLTSCKSVEYVPVEKVHDIHHYHTDSVKLIDSVFTERETTIMQLDSAAMAQYGIRLKNAEKAWLVKTKELERQLQLLAETRRDSIHIHDSIPVPYKVEVEKKLTFWQNTKQNLGGYALVICLGALIYIFARFYLRR